MLDGNVFKHLHLCKGPHKIDLEVKTVPESTFPLIGCRRTSMNASNPSEE